MTEPSLGGGCFSSRFLVCKGPPWGSTHRRKMTWSKIEAQSFFWWLVCLKVDTSCFGMCFIYSDSVVYFGRVFRNELKVTVKLGNFDFPRFKISIFISNKTTFQCYPEHKFLRRWASCQGIFIYLLLGNSVLSKAKTGSCACCHLGDSLWHGTVILLWRRAFRFSWESKCWNTCHFPVMSSVLWGE